MEDVQDTGDATPGDTTPDGGIVVRLGPGRYAVPLPAVAEVGRPPVLTRVPGVPHWLAGVANWRGRVLPVVDVRSLLAAEPAGPGPASRLVVLAHDGFTVGLVADAVEGTLALPTRLEPPPTTLNGAAHLLAGQVLDDAGPVGVLDVDALLALRDELPRPRRTG